MIDDIVLNDFIRVFVSGSDPLIQDDITDRKVAAFIISEGLLLFFVSLVVRSKHSSSIQQQHPMGANVIGNNITRKCC